MPCLRLPLGDQVNVESSSVWLIWPNQFQTAANFADMDIPLAGGHTGKVTITIICKLQFVKIVTFWLNLPRFFCSIDSMPRTGLSPDEIKSKAIEITVEKMRTSGFDKVRLVDVAKTIGVSHAVLYNHFSGKAELLDAVSGRWLAGIDEELEKICASKKDPIQKIHSWFRTLHRLKAEKVRHDPELYKSFDMAAENQKPVIQRHLQTTQRQMVDLVAEAMDAGKMGKADPTQTARILNEAMIAFHHPKIVAQYIDEDREPLLKQILDVVIKGLK
jgi:AcrR family transcriptional regulator